MTYPPQQPGPYGQQNPYGQQPQQYGQQPQFGGPQWGQQPGFPAAPPPKKKTGLIVTIVLLVVLLAGGGFAAWYFLIKDDGGGSGGGGADPRAAADTYVKELTAAVNIAPADTTLDKVKPVMCADDYTELNKDLQNAKKDEDASETPTDKTTFSVSNFKEEGEGATFDLARKRGDNSGDPLPMEVKKEDGNFVVCGLFAADESGSGEGTSGADEPTSESGGGGNGSIPNPIPKSSN